MNLSHGIEVWGITQPKQEKKAPGIGASFGSGVRAATTLAGESRHAQQG